VDGEPAVVVLPGAQLGIDLGLFVSLNWGLRACSGGFCLHSGVTAPLIL